MRNSAKQRFSRYGLCNKQQRRRVYAFVRLLCLFWTMTDGWRWPQTSLKSFLLCIHLRATHVLSSSRNKLFIYKTKKETENCDHELCFFFCFLGRKEYRLSFFIIKMLTIASTDGYANRHWFPIHLVCFIQFIHPRTPIFFNQHMYICVHAVCVYRF